MQSLDRASPHRHRTITASAVAHRGMEGRPGRDDTAGTELRVGCRRGAETRNKIAAV